MFDEALKLGWILQNMAHANANVVKEGRSHGLSPSGKNVSNIDSHSRQEISGPMEGLG